MDYRRNLRKGYVMLDTLTDFDETIKERILDMLSDMNYNELTDFVDKTIVETAIAEAYANEIGE